MGQSIPMNSYQNEQQQQFMQPNHDDFNDKILSMMEVFKSEINALNSEVNELKSQNQELRQNMIHLQTVQNQQQRTKNVMPPIPTNRLHQTQNTNTSSSSSNRSSMGYDQMNNQNTLNPPKSIRISKSLRKLKIKKDSIRQGIVMIIAMLIEMSGVIK